MKIERLRKERREKEEQQRDRQSKDRVGAAYALSIHHSECYVALSCLGAVSLHP